MMQATLLNGALPGDTFVDAISNFLPNALQVAGWTVTPWTLHDQKIAYCLMGDLGRMMQARRNRVLARLAARPFGQK